MKNRSRSKKWFRSVYLALFFTGTLLIIPALSDAIPDYRFHRILPTLQQAQYFGPAGIIAIDNKGYVYLADSQNDRIQMFTLSGQLITKWGSHGQDTGEFDFPKGITTDYNTGNVFVVDKRNHRIQVFTFSGDFVTKWGTQGAGDGQFSWVDDYPVGIAVDSKSNVYVVDSGNNRIQVFTSEGTYITQWGGYGTGNGKFDNPKGIAIDHERGFVYVSDHGNHQIQVFDMDGAYLRQWGSYGSGDYQFKDIFGVDVDLLSGNLYVTEKGDDVNDPVPNRIKVYSPTGVFLTKWGYLGRDDGEFYSAVDVTIAQKTGVVFVTDTSSRIQLFSLDGDFVTKWGSQSIDPGFFDRPTGVAIDDASGRIYVVDSWNNRIQVFDSDGSFNFQWGEIGGGNYNFFHPKDIVVNNNKVYVSDKSNDRIQIFDINGVYQDTWGESLLDSPIGITVYNNKLYVADYTNRKIRVFDLNGTLQSTWDTYELKNPYGIAIHDGKVYYTEYFTNRVVVLDLNGDYQYSWGEPGTNNNQFNRPAGIAIDGTRGIIYIADSYNNRVQAFSPTGQYLTTVGEIGSEPGMIINPVSVSLNEDGDVYVAEELGNNRVQVFKPIALSAGTTKAILVAGGGSYPGNHLWNATQMNANFAYRSLTYQGFTKDTIYYISSDLDLDLDNNGVLDDVDADATNDNIEDALKIWATDADSLVFYLVGHGGNETYRTSSTEILLASQLGDWLDVAMDYIPGEAIIIYDACDSGTFMQDFTAGAGTSRIGIASTSPGESADFVGQGSVSYSNHFWTHIFNGVDVGTAFEFAAESIGYTALYQNPVLDADGNSIANESNDITLASEVVIGNGTEYNGEAPFIGSTATDPAVISGISSANIIASGVVDSDGIARVWAIIRPPAYMQGSSDNPVQELPLIELMPTNEGQYEGVYDGFNIEGSYYVLIYAKDKIGNTSMPTVKIVYVGDPIRRKAIIVAGGTSSDDTWQAVVNNTTLAYETLSFQGYSDDDIYFMSNEIFSTGRDAAANLSILDGAIGTWAGLNTQDLVIYLIGEGEVGSFKMDSTDSLTADHLDSLLDILQADLPGKITVVYDASYSASFLPYLTPPQDKERILIASTKKDRQIHFVSDGDISFSKFFWNRILNGADVWESFVHAKNAIWYATGQDPQLDDTGDGIGNDFEDGGLARNYNIGIGIVLAGDDPVIGSVVPGITLHGTSSYTIWAKDVTTTGILDKVFAVITPPGYHNELLGKTLEELPFLPLIYNPVDERYEGTYHDFSLFGTYNIAIYAQDTEGSTSLTKETWVTQLEGPDPFEEDDSHDNANVIIIQHGWEELYETLTQTHTFHDEGDEDWVRFYGIANQSYEIKTSNVGSRCDSAITIYDSNINEIVTRDDEHDEGVGEFISWPCTSDGFYFVKINQSLNDPSVHGEDTQYDLTVYLPIAGIPGTLLGYVFDEEGQGIGGGGDKNHHGFDHRDHREC